MIKTSEKHPVKGALMLSKSGKKLEEIIKKAIEDHVITTSEYEEIIAMANEDGVIDAHERVLLQQLNDMIADRTVKRIAG
jgi:hypothetical protein